MQINFGELNKKKIQVVVDFPLRVTTKYSQNLNFSLSFLTF